MTSPAGAYPCAGGGDFCQGGPVYASRDGFVTTAVNDNASNLNQGNHVIIDHGSGYFTRTLHMYTLNPVLCAAGNACSGMWMLIKAGTLIGYEGRTGATVRHSHFEVDLNGPYPPKLSGGQYVDLNCNPAANRPAGAGNCHEWDDNHGLNETVASAGTSDLAQRVNYEFGNLKTYDTVGVYQKWGSGVWYLNNGLDGAYEHAFPWGGSSWSPAYGDFNADGFDTVAVADDSQPVNYLRDSSPPTCCEYGFWVGYSWFDKRFGDWDGNGTTTPGFVTDDPGFGLKVWYLYNSNSNSNGPGNWGGATGSWSHAFHYGALWSRQTTGDFNCDGTTDIAVVADDGTSNGNYWDISLDRGASTWQTWRFGSPGDLPVAGDWDGDGCDSIGVYRPSTGRWYLKNVSSTSAWTWDIPDFVFGGSSDTPITGDWNGL